MTAPWTGLGSRHERWLRVVIFLIWAIKPLLEPARSLSHLPAAAFDFALPLRILPDAARTVLLQPGVLGTLDVLLTLSALAAATGRGLRATAPLALLAALAHQSLLNSLGYVGHESVALWLVTLGFVLFRAAGARARIDDLFLLTAAIVTVGYALTGAFRLFHGTPTIFVDDSLPYWSARNQLYDCWEARVAAAWMPRDGLFAADGPICRAGFVGIAALEVLAPLSLASRRAAVVFLPAMILFHLTSLVVLSIFFWESTALLGVLWLALGRGSPQKCCAQTSSGSGRGPATRPFGGGSLESNANASSR